MQQLFDWGGGMWGGIGLAVLQILAFVVILLVSIAFLLLITYVPIISTWLPDLLMGAKS